MNSKLLEHLRARPIAPIVNASTEIDNDIVLKLMCVIDYQLENNQLYPELMSLPKLMNQLLNLYSFGSFKYFKYKVPMVFNIGGVLKCKYCELIGPYIVMLEHMTINHNIHINTNLCMWCEKTDVKTHIAENTVDQCRQAYMSKFSSVYYPPVVNKFYVLLEKLAAKLKVKIIRRENFRNDLSAKKFEIIPGDHDQSDDIDPQIIVFRAKNTLCNNIDAVALEKLYQTAMTALYGYTARTQFSFNVIDNGNNPPPQNGAGLKKTHPVNSNAQSSTALSSPQSVLQIHQVHSTQQMAAANSQPTASNGNENNYMKFIGTLLSNMQSPQLKTEAKLKVQELLINYSAKDLMQQMVENNLCQHDF